MRTFGFRVSGVVQGVGYRAYTERSARQVGGRGWCRNTAGGQVEGVVSLPDEGACSSFLEALRRGPPRARVEDIVTWPAEDEGLVTFVVRP